MVSPFPPPLRCQVFRSLRHSAISRLPLFGNNTPRPPTRGLNNPPTQRPDSRNYGANPEGEQASTVTGSPVSGPTNRRPTRPSKQAQDAEAGVTTSPARPHPTTLARMATAAPPAPHKTHPTQVSDHLVIHPSRSRRRLTCCYYPLLPANPRPSLQYHFPSTTHHASPHPYARSVHLSHLSLSPQLRLLPATSAVATPRQTRRIPRAKPYPPITRSPRPEHPLGNHYLDLTFHLFVCALAGAGAAVIAMVHFLMALAANWGYLKDASRMQKYEDIKSKEEQELHDIHSTRSKERLNAYT
uniref:Neuronal membrane glycoprotein M6-a n=1 Tax=Knipowitschia caucasica TaxID=637954 RepID=A0AAV2LN99_KNICA